MFLGLLFIVAGIGFAGNSLGLWHFHLFFKGWWTLFIILPCLINIMQKGANGGNVVGLCVGVMLFLSSRGFLDFGIVRRLIVPVLCILIGVSFLLGDSRKKIQDKEGQPADYGESASYTQGESGGLNFHGRIFEGAPVRALFGNAYLDLRNALITRDVRVDASAVFGGVEILVPDNVTVKVLSTPVLGSVSNKAAQPVSFPAHTLYINATCVFGGITIH